MYYSNIQNKELAYFHNRPVHNFTVKLSQILTSPLFKVEEIITDQIYKIYPLFYTGTITSSNSNDRILNNKLIIAQKTEDETYYTFISDENKGIIDYSEYGTYYTIGDQLTESQFNAYVSLLKQNVQHGGSFRISQGEIQGSYGTYEFDLDNTTLIDNGIIITDETISAEPKVRLTNNVFGNSTYTLKLKVMHYTGANILDDITEDFKVVDTLEIELIPNTWVNIPVDTLEKDYIISLNASVEIKHNKPVITGPPSALSLTSSKQIIQTGTPTILSCTVRNMFDKPVSDAVVSFLDSESTIIGTATTDNNGIANYTLTGSGLGRVSYIANTNNIDSNTVELLDAYFYDTGVLGTYNTDYYNYFNRLSVNIDADGTLLSADKGYTGYYFPNLYGTSTSSVSNMRDYNVPVCIEIDLVETDPEHREGSNYYGFQFNDGTDHRLTLRQINPYAQYLKIYLDGEYAVCYYDNSTTPVTIPFPLSGDFSIALIVRIDSYLKFKEFIVYNDDSPTPPVVPATVSLSASPSSVFYGGTVTFTSVVEDENSNPLSGQMVTFKEGATTVGTAVTGSDGIATLTKSNLSVGTHTVTATSGEITSSSVTVTVNALPTVDSVVLSVTPATITEGGSVLLEAVVEDQYGTVMEGETVTFTENGVTLGTDTTDVNGVATLTKSDFIIGVHSITANSNNVTSNTVNVTVNSPSTPTTITLVSDKPVLSYYDRDECVLSATVLDGNGDGVSGETVTFKKGTTTLGTATTDSNGVATYIYESAGTGDVEFTASCRNIVSERYVVDDCGYANDGSTVNGLTAQSGVSVTSDGEWVSISTSTSGEKYVITPTSFSSSDNFEFKCKINKTNSNFHAIAFAILDENNFSSFNNVYMNYDVSTNNFNLRLIGNSGSVTKVSRTLSDGDTITIQRQNEAWIVLHNDEQIHTIAYSWIGNKTLGFYTNKDRKQLLKNLKIKAL